MRAGWKMENVPSVVCLMAGFLSAHHTAGVPGWSRQHPSAGHCREKTHCFSTHIIIIISLNSHCSATSKHPAMGRRCSSPTSKHLPEDLNAVICDYFQCQLICWCFFLMNQLTVLSIKKGIVKNTYKCLQSQRWQLQMACFVQPMVQNPKILNLQQYKMKSRKSSCFRNWNYWMFWHLDYLNVLMNYQNCWYLIF